MEIKKALNAESFSFKNKKTNARLRLTKYEDKFR
jgi:hypothetical protein